MLEMTGVAIGRRLEMFFRIIDRDLYEMIADELAAVKRTEVGRCLLLAGRHADFGSTVLVRNGDEFVALVDDPTCMDLVRAKELRSDEGAVLAQAMRAGR